AHRSLHSFPTRRSSDLTRTTRTELNSMLLGTCPFLRASRFFRGVASSVFSSSAKNCLSQKHSGRTTFLLSSIMVPSLLCKSGGQVPARFHRSRRDNRQTSGKNPPYSTRA